LDVVLPNAVSMSGPLGSRKISAWVVRVFEEQAIIANTAALLRGGGTSRSVLRALLACVSTLMMKCCDSCAARMKQILLSIVFVGGKPSLQVTRVVGV
jgi:hypothetical protein